MAIIYHVTTGSDWYAAQQKGGYVAESLNTEGFIHCSEANQVDGVLERYYKGQENLVKLVIDTDKLQHPLVREMSASVGQEFPHVYGPINIDAVIEVVAI